MEEHIMMCEANTRRQLIYNRLRTLCNQVFNGIVDIGLLCQEMKPPYMKFIRTTKNGRVVWKKESKQLPDIKRIEEIEDMKTEEARKLATEDKVIWFYSKIDACKKQVERTSYFLTSAPIMIVVERANLLRDSFEQFRTTTDLDLRKELKIHFLDEVCQDAGGLIREWFSLITEELFSASFGLFARTNTRLTSYTINPESKEFHANHLDYYFFCGRIIAKALFEKVPIKAYLAKFILKQLTDESIVAEDLKYFDEELWSSIKFLKSNSIQAELQIGTFTATHKSKHTQKPTTINLKKGGDKILIAEENKDEFIELFYQYHLTESIRQQLNALSSGIYSLIPRNHICVVDCEELEFFICGDCEISLTDWKANTRYIGIYHKSHPVIEWFWKVLSKFSSSELEKFFQFCTGSVRVPIEGFKGLTSNNGKLCGFSVEAKEYKTEETSFIVAHTCFNRIELPEYPNIDVMEKSMRRIINTPLCYQFSFE